ncbi:MAG: DNA polymerase III subunit beta [Kyrpidia sp.]|nr:DNA polymerase III subunit beta [Kyrpidia sp.]
MKVRVQQQRLSAAIQQVQRAVATHSTLPILSGIKIVAAADVIHFTATDLEVAVETWIPADAGQSVSVDLPGTIVLPAKYMSEVVRKLPEPWVHLTVDQPYSARIESGSASFVLHGFDPEEFPRLPQVTGDQPFVLQSDALKTALRQTIVAAAVEETRPVLTGLCLSFDSDSVTFVATDSHRLAIRTLFLQGGPEASVHQAVVPGKSVQELIRLLPDDDSSVELVIADNTLLVQTPSVRFYSRLLEGQYPDTSKIIPTTYKTRIQINPDIFVGALERAQLIAREMQNQVVRAQLQQAQMELSTHSHDVGRLSEVVPVEQFTGDPFTIAFNAKYMLDAVRAFDGDRVTLDFTGAMSPMILRPIDGQEYLHLVLPVRTV